MNEKEARQHARDIKTVEKAVGDQSAGKYDSPVKPWNPLPSDEKAHDQTIYDAAYKEAKKHKH